MTANTVAQETPMEVMPYESELLLELKAEPESKPQSQSRHAGAGAQHPRHAPWHDLHGYGHDEQLDEEGPRSKAKRASRDSPGTVSYTHLRAHETRHDLVCRLLLEKK